MRGTPLPIIAPDGAVRRLQTGIRLLRIAAADRPDWPPPSRDGFGCDPAGGSPRSVGVPRRGRAALTVSPGTAPFSLSLRALLGALIAWIVLTSTGCTRYYKLGLAAGPCLNPPAHYCKPDGSDSRILEFTVYQLKRFVDPAKLSWNELLDEPRSLQALGSYLTDMQQMDRVRVPLAIQRNETREEPFRRVKGTRYLLIVTQGRFAGKSSIVLAPVGCLRRREQVRFDYYDAKVPVRRHVLCAPDERRELENP